MSQNLKETSLNIIALEYGSSESDTETNIEENTKTNATKSENTENVAINKKSETNTEENATKSENTENVAINKKSEDLCIEQNSIDHLSYRDVVEVSSSEDSDSEDSEDSDSSTDTSSSDESESDVPCNSNRKKENFKQKKCTNELEYLPPIEHLNLSVPEVSCELLGKIEKIVEEVIVIEPLPHKPRLDISSILFIDQGKQSLGRIYDVYGKVNEPYYCVRFNSSEHAQKNDLISKQVYYCPNKQEYTSLIFLHELIKIKAYDPVGDDEPPDFSDDEEERAYYAQRNNSKDERSHKRRKTSDSRNQESSRVSYSRQRNTSNSRNIRPYFNSLPRYPCQSNAWPPIPLNVHPAHSNFHVPRNSFVAPRYNSFFPPINRPISYYNSPYANIWHMNTYRSSVNPHSLFPLPPPPPPPVAPSPLPPYHATNNSDTSLQ